MFTAITVVGYIDPNTSQHVFSLLGPILACLATMGGLVATAVVLVRHHIVSYFRRASHTKRVTTVIIAVGILAVIAWVVWWLLS